METKCRSVIVEVDLHVVGLAAGSSVFLFERKYLATNPNGFGLPTVGRKIAPQFVEYKIHILNAGKTLQGSCQALTCDLHPVAIPTCSQVSKAEFHQAHIQSASGSFSHAYCIGPF